MSRILRKRGAVKANFPRKAEFVQRVRDCLALARQKYPTFTLEDKDLPIVFYKKGHAAGKAVWTTGAETVYNIEFSVEAIGLEWDDMVNETIPHEVAHIVDRFIHGRSNNHNKVWKVIFRSLGGVKLKSTHNYAVTKARKTTKILYRATCGTEIWLTKRMHSQVQQGQVRVIRRTDGLISAESCQWVSQKV